MCDRRFHINYSQKKLYHLREDARLFYLKLVATMDYEKERRASFIVNNHRLLF